MKTRFLFSMLLLMSLLVWSSENATQLASEKEPIKICVTPDMENMAEIWISNYIKINPDQKFELNNISIDKINTEVAGENTIGIVKRSPDIETVATSLWHITLGREVIVPVVNTSNPYFENLKSAGISIEALAGLVSNKNPGWGDVLGDGINHRLTVVLENESEVELLVAKFLGLEPSAMNTMNSGNDFIQMIRNDIYSIGFCKLVTLTDVENNEFAANISPLPLDRNDNGKIDSNENIYGSLDQFERSIWIGKYPRSLICNIYALATEQPKNQSVIDFLNWTFTLGQSAVEESGYTDLAYYEKQSSLGKLNPVVRLTMGEASSNNAVATRILILVFVVLAVVVLLMVWNLHRKSHKLLYDNTENNSLLRPESIKTPEGLFYDKKHTWAFMEKDGVVKIGIDDFLQHVTGNYTGLVVKSPNEVVRRNEIIATLVHEGKKINIYAPVSGRIIQTNEDLMDFPSLANNSPYNWGWLYEMEPTNWIREIAFLKMAEQYRTWISKELTRFKDFIIEICQQKELEGQLVLQEGGDLPDHVLHDFEPHVWEEFQIRFIDNSDIY
ncbi:hypothetical protein [Draconibacterium mangrovi]|uniref:hypothetical protein n=1 Tax=Draconibacterium mangrovi TaxID=2697469 RepID=UPI0013D019B9|nr:hypothetical protein [Draconibacterium mangrovi]